MREGVAPLAQGTEKTASTFVQAAIVAFSMAWIGGRELDWSLQQQLLAALTPTALTALMAFSGKLDVPTRYPRWVQGAWRSVRTVAVQYVGLLLPLVSEPGFSFDRASLWSAAGAAGAGLLAALKASVFGHVGNKDTVAALPAKLDTSLDASVVPVVLPNGGVLVPPVDDPNAFDDAGPKEPGQIPEWAA